MSVNLLCGHIYLHIVGLQSHIFILYIALVVDIDALVQNIVEERVGILSCDNLFDRCTLLLASGVGTRQRFYGESVRSERITQRSGRYRVAQSSRAACSTHCGCSLLLGALFYGIADCRYGRCGNRDKGIPLARLLQLLLGDRVRCRKSEHNMSYCQGNNQQNEIFQSKMFQKFQNFLYLCRRVGKNAKTALLYARARVFSARKDSEKSIYIKLYGQLSTFACSFRGAGSVIFV